MGADVADEGGGGITQRFVRGKGGVQAGDQGAADDDAVGKVGHLSRGVAVADAEADANGDVGLAFQGADVGGNRFGLCFLRAGDAAQGDEVEEAAGVLEDGLAVVVGATSMMGVMPLACSAAS